MREEVDVLGSSSLTIPTVSVEVKQQLTNSFHVDSSESGCLVFPYVSLYDHLAVNICIEGKKS